MNPNQWNDFLSAIDELEAIDESDPEWPAALARLYAVSPPESQVKLRPFMVERGLLTC